MQMQSNAAFNLLGSIPLEERMSRQIRLRAAVLIEAIRCLEGTSGTRGERLILQRQAVRWFRGAEPASPFSFQRVCESLGIDPARVRRTVFRRCLCPQDNAQVRMLVQEIIARGLEDPSACSASASTAAVGTDDRMAVGNQAAVAPTSPATVHAWSAPWGRRTGAGAP